MNNRQDLICIGLPAWEGNYAKSTLQLICHLSAEYRVLYVEYPFTLKDCAQGLLSNKQDIPVSRVLGFSPRLRQANLPNGNHLHVLTLPPTASINWINRPAVYQAALKFNSWIAKQTIKWAQEQLDMRNPIIINAFNPFYSIYTLGSFGESHTVYYCYDEITHASWTQKYGGWAEQMLMQKADAVVVSSDALYQNKVQSNQQTFVVHNGVDFDLFDRHFDPKPTQTAKPLIGYVGSLDNRLDYDLLEGLIANSPEWQFEFVGRPVDENNLQRLQKYPHVDIVPPVSYEDIPKYIQRYQVGIIPFAQTPFNKNIYPLKINEYLAMGKPVVMTDFAHLPDFDDYARTAHNWQQFKQLIQEELDQDSMEKISHRRQLAKRNSWQNRAGQFSGILQQLQTRPVLQKQHASRS
jgi:glycosyltransferase involved in cell wall biosynthesis